jgi:hypothetical protein
MNIRRNVGLFCRKGLIARQEVTPAFFFCIRPAVTESTSTRLLE